MIITVTDAHGGMAKSILAGLKLLDTMLEGELNAPEADEFRSIVAMVTAWLHTFSGLRPGRPDGWPELVHGPLERIVLLMKPRSPHYQELRVEIRRLIHEMEQLP